MCAYFHSEISEQKNYCRRNTNIIGTPVCSNENRCRTVWLGLRANIISLLSLFQQNYALRSQQKLVQSHPVSNSSAFFGAGCLCIDPIRYDDIDGPKTKMNCIENVFIKSYRHRCYIFPRYLRHHASASPFASTTIFYFGHSGCATDGISEVKRKTGTAKKS